MTKQNLPRETAPLDKEIQKEIIRKEEEKKRKKKDREQPEIPLDIPEYDPEEEERWKKEREEREKDPRGIEKIDLA
ncbi:MAG: hypothetical protein AAB797_03990 [Patescibacteria group bacterium]